MAIAIDEFALETECKDRGGLDRPSVWLVTLRKGKRAYRTEFTQGSGLRVWKRVLPFMVASAWQKYYKPGRPVGTFPKLAAPEKCRDVAHQQKAFDSFAEITEPIAPTLEDVLHCLVSDVSSVRHGQSFAEWASDLGYNPDSVTARRAFSACVHEWRGLVRLART